MPATNSTSRDLLRSNPFATRFIIPGARNFLLQRDGACEPVERPFLESIVDRLRSAQRGLIIGPHGTGKSTLVQALFPTLRECYPSVVMTRLNRMPVGTVRLWLVQHIGNSRSILELAHHCPRGGLVIIDGLEQIPAISRAWFCAVLASRSCDLLATSHHQMLGFTELYRTGLTPILILQLMMDLTSQCDDDDLATLEAELSRRDLSQVTDARELWFQLYDVVADSRSNTRLLSASSETPSIAGTSRNTLMRTH